MYYYRHFIYLYMCKFRSTCFGGCCILGGLQVMFYFLFLIVVKYIYNVKFTILSVQFHLIKNIHTTVQPSPLSISSYIHLSLYFQIETLYPLNTYSSFSFLMVTANHHYALYLYGFDYSRYLIQVNTGFVVVQLAQFIYFVFKVHLYYGRSQNFLPL